VPPGAVHHRTSGDGKRLIGIITIFCEALSGNEFPGLSPGSLRSIVLLRLQNQAPGLASR